jgi:hypothetical protein
VKPRLLLVIVPAFVISVLVHYFALLPIQHSRVAPRYPLSVVTGTVTVGPLHKVKRTNRRSSTCDLEEGSQS